MWCITYFNTAAFCKSAILNINIINMDSLVWKRRV